MARFLAKIMSRRAMSMVALLFHQMHADHHRTEHTPRNHRRTAPHNPWTAWRDRVNLATENPFLSLRASRELLVELKAIQRLV
jgi:hypothetical protein